MPIRSDLVMPATKVRSEFTKILPLVKESHYCALTYKGYPRYAIVDLDYSEMLEDRRLFEKASQATSQIFANYLKKIGKDISTISEKEANAIIWRLAGID